MSVRHDGGRKEQVRPFWARMSGIGQVAPDDLDQRVAAYLSERCAPHKPSQYLEKDCSTGYSPPTRARRMTKCVPPRWSSSSWPRWVSWCTTRGKCR